MKTRKFSAPPPGTEIHLIWDEALLTIVPSFELLEAKVLTYRQKGMVRQDFPPFEMKQVTEKVAMFTFKQNCAQGRVITTWQGLWKDVIDFLKKHKYVVRFHDTRQPFMPPQVKRMHGFRGDQGQLLMEALNKNCSGLIGAPTRYGKTILILNTCSAYAELCIVIILPGEDLVNQMFEDVIKRFWKAYEGQDIAYDEDGVRITKLRSSGKIAKLGAGSTTQFMGTRITVCSMDSIHKLDPGAVDMALIDEPHMIVTDGRTDDFSTLEKCRKLGFGATLDARYDGKDIMIKALIGPLLSERTYRQAVASGMVCQITTFMIRVPFAPLTKTKKRATVYDTLLYRNARIASFTKWICHELLPKDWQTLLFIKNEDQANYFKDFLGEEGTIAMAKKMTKTERKEMTALMKANIVKRCLASVIYSTGVTFNHCRVVINLEGGGAYSGSVQKPGRVAEVRPGKRRGVLFDFLFEQVGQEKAVPGPWQGLASESRSRMKRYQKTGYETMVFDIENLSAIKGAFEAICK